MVQIYRFWLIAARGRKWNMQKKQLGHFCGSARVALRQAPRFSFKKGMSEEPHRPLHPSVSIDGHQIA